ncbi:putative NmrA-like domain, NAD(P)-binding domain superfamily [Septoria linicola]|nr:putative NmrA-like domain, NAD(P)-binding domain superfamily [Septoria linicola]
MRGQDVVICMVGGQASGDQNVLIDAALAAGVKRFIPSEFGPYSPDPQLQAINPHTNVAKTKTVEYLKRAQDRMSWTSLVTGGFFDWAMKVGFFGFDLQNQTVGLIDDGTQVFTATLLSTIGRALIAVLEHAGETRNQYVIVSSFNVSQRDILEVLERVSNKTWNVEHLDSDAVIANGERRLQEGDFAGIMDLTRGAAFGKRGRGHERKRGFWNDRLGLPEDDFEEAVRQVLQEV